MNKVRSLERRNFLKSTAALAAAAIPLEPMLGGRESRASASVINYNPAARAGASFGYRLKTAADDFQIRFQPDNGDAEKFTDFSWAYAKALQFDALGVPNAQSWHSLQNALTSGDFSDFEKILVGNPSGGPNSLLNGPQGSLAFDLEGLDSHVCVIPPCPSVASAQTASEQVEHYWGALMRDVQFSEYSSSPLAAQACADMNRMSFLASPANVQCPFPVTPQNMFRGQFFKGDGNVQGPYISQFMVQPTFLGAQPLSQQYQTFLPLAAGGSDYMTSVSEYQLVESGGSSGRQVAVDPNFRYVRCGRDLAAYTRVDVLYQAYFVAALILSGIKAPLNPGNPYKGSKTEKGFGTLGGPDLVATLAEMATRALKAAWFHKWVVDMRLRPEAYAALVQANLTHAQPMPQAAAALHPDALNSAALPLIHSRYDTYLLPQAFPEGSPTHPCYPTGHGAVGGACITVLKFFFDGSQEIRPLLTAAGRDVKVPSLDGFSLNLYTGCDANALTINGELSKLAWNISTGHGIHAGIHFRSSTYWSILLGEQVALAVLQDRANSYTEPFSITITKFDGTTATISN